MSAQIAVQRVQAPAGQIHILGHLRLFESGQSDNATVRPLLNLLVPVDASGLRNQQKDQ